MQCSEKTHCCFIYKLFSMDPTRVQHSTLAHASNVEDVVLEINLEDNVGLLHPCICKFQVTAEESPCVKGTRMRVAYLAF